MNGETTSDYIVELKAKLETAERENESFKGATSHDWRNSLTERDQLRARVTELEKQLAALRYALTAARDGGAMEGTS